MHSFIATTGRTVLQTSDLNVPERTQGQFVLSLFAVAVIIIALLAAYRRTRFAGLDGDAAEHKSALLGAMREQTPETLHIPRSADVDDYRENLVDAFDRVEKRARENAAVAHNPERVPVREAARKVARSLYESSEQTLPTVPQATIRVGVLAIAVAVLGALAVSTEWIVDQLTRDAGGGGGPGLGALVGHAVSLTESAVDGVISVLAVFPGAVELAGILFAIGVLAFTILYENYLLMAVLLGLLAGGIAVLDREVPDEIDTTLYRHDRSSLMLVSVGAVVAVWLAGVIPTATGALIGDVDLIVVTIPFPTLGAGLGGLLSLGTVALLLRMAFRSLRVRMRHAATIDWDEGPDLLVAGYLVTTYVGLGLALVAAPLVPAYLAAIFVQGAAVEILAALFMADALVQVGLLAVVLAVCGGIAYVARDQWDDVHAAVSEALSRQAVRLALFRRGTTIGAGLFAFALLYALLRSAVLALAGALLFGAVVHAGYVIVDRAAHRLSLVGDADPRGRGALIQCYALPDADEDYHLVAKVGSEYRVSRRDVDATVDDVLRVADAAQHGDDPPIVIGRKRAEDLLELGQVDADVVDELRERVRKKLRYQTQPGDRQVSKDELEEMMSEFPESIWRPQIEHWEQLGILIDHGDRLERTGDPWSADGLSLSGQNRAGP
ncbi:hypothetical protein SAMN05216226_102173 [Halovenus aranensis]|uniref:Uncharacterized protein n=1 Tax=Halovenus aranensis TaxID=890420 RepID=A0A1G8SXV9_9EURY|nr:hypothetical protein [Halovenus aranensis]SDJ33380.1 hypothetical protein SAMN05216226_102173 [Halovenus aranensis]